MMPQPQSAELVDSAVPELTLTVNNDIATITAYRIARIVYAETRGSSLRAIESLCSMIANLREKTEREFSDIAADENVFESLRRDSERHGDLLIDSNNRRFQICLRSVRRMLNGMTDDMVFGATRFHRAENNPAWSVFIGWIAEADDLLFYK